MLDSKGGKFLLLQAPAMLWAAAIFVASSIPSSSLPEMSVVNEDKLIHLGVYALLGFLTYRALRHQEVLPKVREHALTLAFFACSLYGMSDELHQLLTPGRSCDFWDWAADASGSVLGLLIVRFLWKEPFAGAPPAR